MFNDLVSLWQDMMSLDIKSEELRTVAPFLQMNTPAVREPPTVGCSLELNLRHN